MVDFCLLNVRSIKNKAVILNDFVVYNKIDIMAFTETWLNPVEAENLTFINELTPIGGTLSSTLLEMVGVEVLVFCSNSLCR